MNNYKLNVGKAGSKSDIEKKIWGKNIQAPHPMYVHRDEETEWKSVEQWNSGKNNAKKGARQNKREREQRKHVTGLNFSMDWKSYARDNINYFAAGISHMWHNAMARLENERRWANRAYTSFSKKHTANRRRKRSREMGEGGRVVANCEREEEAGWQKRQNILTWFERSRSMGNILEYDNDNYAN